MWVYNFPFSFLVKDYTARPWDIIGITKEMHVILPQNVFSLYFPNFGDNKTALTGNKIKENTVERNGIIGASSKVTAGYGRNRWWE